MKPEIPALSTCTCLKIFAFHSVFFFFVFCVVAARIDIMTLQLLEPNDIRLLISPIGDQLRFKSNFELWKREMNVCTANVVCVLKILFYLLK